jgi:RNA polymerase sigma-70 factor (ECF subfamily)
MQTTIETPDQSGNAGFDEQDVALRALLSGIAGGDEEALARFYDATVNRVYALALRICRRAADAEEVVSDVYFQVWRQASHYSTERGKATTWIYTICRSRALDALRKREPAQSAPDPHELADEPQALNASPLVEVLNLEQGSLLRKAMDSLEKLPRELLALAYFRGMSHQEIADLTGMPLGTVKTVIRKAMQTLKQILTETVPTAGEYDHVETRSH